MDRRKLVLKKQYGWKVRRGIMACGHLTANFFPDEPGSSEYCSVCSPWGWHFLEMVPSEGTIRVWGADEIDIVWHPGGFPERVFPNTEDGRIIWSGRCVRDQANDQATAWLDYYFSSLLSSF